MAIFGNAYTHMHTHTHTYTHTSAHTHTRTGTHTLAASLCSLTHLLPSPPHPPPHPPGAGKTNIAMIAVLREVGANMRHGVIQRADFKIVYVAPMKVGSRGGRRGPQCRSGCSSAAVGL